MLKKWSDCYYPIKWVDREEAEKLFGKPKRDDVEENYQLAADIIRYEGINILVL